MIRNLLDNFTQHYDWSIAIIHFFVAFVSISIVNWFGSHSISVGYMQMSIAVKEETAPAFNLIFKALAPIVFFVFFVVAVQSVGSPQLVNFSYLIILYYWLIRAITIIIMGHARLLNWSIFFVYFGVSMGLSLWIYSLVEKVDKLLPDPRSLLDQLWILIIIFIYGIFNNLEISQKGSIKRKNKYINNKYHILKQRYGSIISYHCSNEFYEATTYAIMIYEDFNRPVIVRWIEYMHFFITKRPHTLGIMQVRTKKYISNEKSIIMGINIIKNATLKYKKENNPDSDSPNDAVSQIAGIYNCNNEVYKSEVGEIFTTIKEKYSKLDDNYSEIAI